MSDYRYSLTRLDRGDDAARVAWVMVNPSTADAFQDDATIRRVRGFSFDEWGYDSFQVGNLFAYRATDPSDLIAAHKAGEDIVGPDNDKVLRAILHKANRIVFAWGGTVDRLPKDLAQRRIAEVKALCADLHVRPVMLGDTKSGQPRHPLMLKKNTKPVNLDGSEVAWVARFGHGKEYEWMNQ